MRCPSCGETNDEGMAFCILCGHSLAPPPPPAPVSAPVKLEELQLSGQRTVASVLVCTVCNKTDPLNGQFCVYCGGRTVPAPPSPPGQQINSSQTPLPLSASSNYPPMPQAGRISGTQDSRYLLSEEIVRSLPVKPTSAAGANRAVLLLILCVILGATAAGMACFATKDIIINSALRSSGVSEGFLPWPKDGLLLFTAVPNAFVTIENAKKDSLVLGKTSADGSLYIHSLAAGDCLLTLSDNNGKSMGMKFSVNSAELNLLGYKKRLRL